MSHSLDPMVREAVTRLCEAGQSARCLTVEILVRYSEWDQLALLRVDPLQYLDVTDYYVDAVATEFLRKFEPLPTSYDRSKNARENALKAEAQCYKANERLSPYLYSILRQCLQDGADAGVLAYVRQVRKMIRSVLGPVPSTLDGRHGPGATFADRGRYTTVPDKMSSVPTATADCNDIMHYFWAETAWGRACYSQRTPVLLSRGNRFTTVPKDAVKHRGIAVEPSINVFYQLSVGSHIKGRLKKAGLDPQRGQEVHKQVACLASRDGSLCTIDLSNASDTVSYNLVKLLLPEDWFQLFDSLRCAFTHGMVEKSWLRLEKFSSMGNGFTFELETLIFGCLTAVACREAGFPGIWGQDVFTYGDDIICPTGAYRSVKAVLEFFGMSLNDRKSFSEGHFRESCGGDYWGGMDVRPHYLEEDPSEPHQIIALLNGIRRIYRKDWISSGLRGRYLRCWFGVLDALPTSIRRCRGPEGLGDIVIHDDEDRWEPKVRHSIRYFRAWRPVRYKTIQWEHWRSEVVLAAALYGVRDTLRGPLGGRRSLGVVPRDGVSGYGLGWVANS